MTQTYTTQAISANRKGTDFVRMILALIRNKGVVPAAADYAQRQWPDSPAAGLALSKKAFTGALDTSESIAYYGLASQFLELVRPVSVVEALKPRAYNIPFRVPSPIESASPSGSWVAEGGAIPVVAGTLGSVILDLCKMGLIAAVSKELAKYSKPSAEAVVLRILTNAVAFYIDSQFLTPTVAAVEGRNPAAITSSGCLTQASSGATAAAIATDVAAMAAALESWRDVCWITRPQTLAHLAAHNDSRILHFEGKQAYLLGFPLYTSIGSPSQIVLLDIASIAIADEGMLDVSVSTEAALEMSDTPVLGDESPITALETLRSLWQANLAAVRLIRFISWKRTLDSGVVLMQTTY